MAIKDYILKAGELAPESVRSVLEKLFSHAELEKMTQRGARVRVITTSPWPKPPKIPKVKIVIDADYITRLKTLVEDESALEREVVMLNGPQILQLGQIIGIPMAKKTKLTSLRAQLMNSLRSEIVWRGISGAVPPLRPSESSAPNSTP